MYASQTLRTSYCEAQVTTFVHLMITKSQEMNMIFISPRSNNLTTLIATILKHNIPRKSV
ncbi:hypothetical protein KIN20_024444 [Parelaphostrongylus tenuis]|uniref:Uncharacterized protein n=1 Tax=Parelaphostrongylus tenuis TaxID=148309 RepID=A0AAD5QWA4_PARTN|nr:hypothetical protein KIN20_024444 [Parelaphostrongylus tenuis]